MLSGPPTGRGVCVSWKFWVGGCPNTLPPLPWGWDVSGILGGGSFLPTVCCGLLYVSSFEARKEILQSAVNTDGNPFSGPLACGVMSRTVDVSYYISKRAAGFRISTVTFLGAL